MLVKHLSYDEDFEAVCTRLLQDCYEAEQDVKVEIKQVKETRSTLQNAFYWATVQEISKFMIDAGACYILQGVKLEYTRDTVHEINKAMFSIKSTTKLSTKEFIDYMDSVNAFWIEKTNGNYRPTRNAKDL